LIQVKSDAIHFDGASRASWASAARIAYRLGVGGYI
jgi:hypothetical protein